MGTLFVDKLDPQSGTSLELGSSGDTITIPSGATIANSGTATGFGDPVVAGTRRFQARLGSDQSSIAHQTYVKANFDTEVYDSDGTYDTSNKRYTPGVAGVYYIGAKVIYQSGSNAFTQLRLSIYKNGSEFIRNRMTYAEEDGSDLTLQVNANLEANATDYFEIYIWQKNGGSHTTVTLSGNLLSNHFEGFRIA